MPAEGSERRRSPERAATGDPHRFQTFPSPPRNGEVRPQSDHFGAGQITPIFHVLFSGQIVTAAKGGLTSWQLARLLYGLFVGNHDRFPASTRPAYRVLRRIAGA